jgi:hypothetical protein
MDKKRRILQRGLDDTDLLSDSDTDQEENGTVSIEKEGAVQGSKTEPKKQDIDDSVEGNQDINSEDEEIVRRREVLRKVYGNPGSGESGALSKLKG